jgi:hypothetical protein
MENRSLQWTRNIETDPFQPRVGGSVAWWLGWCCCVHTASLEEKSKQAEKRRCALWYPRWEAWLSNIFYKPIKCQLLPKLTILIDLSALDP